MTTGLMALLTLNADFPGPAPEPQQAAERIARLKGRRRDGLRSALLLSAPLMVAASWAPSIVPAIGAGLFAALVVAGLSHAVLSDFLDDCAMYPCMSGHDDVAARRRRLVEPVQVRSLAHCLRKLTDERPGAAVGASAGFEALVIRSRVRAVRPRLLEIADALERERTADPVAIARLWRLLRSGVASPLYNTTLAAEQLDVVLRQALWRIRSGDHRPTADDD
jgi:hypothetical protein